MASRKRRRRRRGAGQNRRPLWTLFWSLAFLSTAGIGLFQSDLTQIAVVRIEGAAPDDRTRLEEILRGIRGVPAFRIDSADVERQVESSRRVLSGRFRTNVFGRARLTVEYRRPVASLSGAPGLAVDGDGYVFEYRRAGALPLALDLPGRDLAPVLGLCDPSRLRPAARLAGKLQEEGVELKGTVFLDASGRLCLNSGKVLLVVFGSGDRLAEKVAVLRRSLNDDPGLPESATEINLVEPEAAMIMRGDR
ncbi:MAG: hypothetical protein IH851_00240 [Armatimonadetes bacterium]|nr:hypothetical protein [Armatimonadota bacterium]